MSFSEFLNMSGYGRFVWPCYGLALIVLVWNAWVARRGLRAQILHARRRVQIQAGGST